jgi:hypothetical protein
MTLFLPMQLYYDLLNKVDREDLALLSLSIPYNSSRKSGETTVPGVIIPKPFPDDMILPSSKIKIEGKVSADNKDIFEAIGYTMPPAPTMPVKVADLGQPATAPAAIPVAKYGEGECGEGKPAEKAVKGDGCSLAEELREYIAAQEAQISSLKGLLARMDECQDE